MDKKNTMLLTVIAVATLLVAVVGATFAYFSIVTSNEGSSSTTFNGKVGNVGNFGMVSLTSVVSELQLDLSAADMSQTNQGKTYYAYAKTVSEQVASKKLTEDFGLTAAFGNFTTQSDVTHYDAKQNHVISAATLSGQTGVNNAVITCKSTVTVELDQTSTMFTDEQAKTFMASGAAQTNGKVYIAGPKNNGSNTHKVTVESGEIDIKDLFSEGNSYKKTVPVTYVFNGSEGGKAAAYVTADVELINSTESQNLLSGKDLKINIKNEGFTCDVTNVGTPAE